MATDSDGQAMGGRTKARVKTPSPDRPLKVVKVGGMVGRTMNGWAVYGCLWLFVVSEFIWNEAVYEYMKDRG